MSEHQFPHIKNGEIQFALDFVKKHPKHSTVAPLDDVPRWDWLMFRTIANAIADRRTPDCNLAQLTGIVVRQFVPAWNKALRLLGMAYRDAMMAVFRARKEWQRLLKKTGGKKKRGRGSPEDSGQLILI